MMFVISEIFPQHRGSVKLAEQMILQSKLAGADAVKVQLYGPEMFPGENGASRAYLCLKFEELKRLKEFADNIHIDLFACAFDGERLKWCEELNFKYLKVAARMHKENPELVKKILNIGKPTFVSVPHDYDINKLEKYNNTIYLYCVGKYPTRIDEIEFPNFKNSLFSGFSDHSIGVGAALYAMFKGAKYLEKHFTLDTSLQNKTEMAHSGSMTMEDLNLIKKISNQFKLIKK